MNSEEIGTVRFGVFLQGRGLQAWEWDSIERLRAAGANCLFILAPQDVAARRSRAARAFDGLVLRIAGLPVESGRSGAGSSAVSAIDDVRRRAHSCRRARPQLGAAAAAFRPLSEIYPVFRRWRGSQGVGRLRGARRLAVHPILGGRQGLPVHPWPVPERRRRQLRTRADRGVRGPPSPPVERALPRTGRAQPVRRHPGPLGGEPFGRSAC